MVTTVTQALLHAPVPDIVLTQQHTAAKDEFGYINGLGAIIWLRAQLRQRRHNIAKMHMLQAHIGNCLDFCLGVGKGELLVTAVRTT